MDKFEYRLDLIKWELDNIESSIRKIDDLGNSTKNWAIITWVGALAVLLKDSNLHSYLYITGLPPLLFLMADAHWRRLQRRFIFRMNKISDFINSDAFDEACKDKNLNGFKVLDPFSRLDDKQSDLASYISLRRIIRYPTISLIYIGQTILSLIIYLALNGNNVA